MLCFTLVLCCVSSLVPRPSPWFQWLNHTASDRKLGKGLKMRLLRDYALQKQVGCFNHRMVALVADKLER